MTDPHSTARLRNKDFKLLSELTESQVGIKMPASKKTMIETRLRKRLRILGIGDYSRYTEYLLSEHGRAHELQHFINAVTTNKTSFFRESRQFDLLRDILKEDASFSVPGILKAWSAASSTGEEAYSIAMVLEQHRLVHSQTDYRVLGTDISSSVLKTARQAIYSHEDIHSIPPMYMKSSLLRGKGDRIRQVRIHPDIRDGVRFMQLNLLHERYPVDHDFNFIFCRNILIYFEKHKQEGIVQRLISHLKPGGYLFMGPTEGLLEAHRQLTRLSTSVFRKPA